MTHVLEKTRDDLESAVWEIAYKIAGDDVVKREKLIEDTVKKAKPVAQKLESDTNGRLRDSLQIFRGCRMLAFQNVRQNTFEALTQELQFINFLPVVVPLVDELKKELRKYKQ